MNLHRKDFLRGLGVGAMALATGHARAEDRPTARSVALPAWDEKFPGAFWSAVRTQFALTSPRTYFNTGGLGPAPAVVLEAMAGATRELQAQVETGHDRLAGARQAVANFLGASAPEVCFVRNATEGNSIVAAGLALERGDEVIFESHAHPGGSFPWLNRQRAHGIKVKIFDPDPTSAQGNVDRIAALITPRTRVIQISHITAPTGIVMPVKAIAALARSHQAWFHVDGAQSAGMVPVNLADLGCDSFATSGHKWLGAPHETGLLFVQRAKLDFVTPIHVGAYSADEGDLAKPFTYVPSAVRFEYGTRNAAAMVAVAEAIRFQDAIGRQRIADRGQALAARVRAGLEKNPDVEILTPSAAGLHASILTFRHRRIEYSRLFGRLLGEFHFRCRPVSEVGLNAIRVSTHVFNSEEECDGLVAAVAKLSAG